MAFTSGTATDYLDLLNRLKQFVTQDMLPANERWSVLRWVPGPPAEMVLQGPGLAGASGGEYWLREWRLASEGESLFPATLKVQSKMGELNLKVSAAKPVVLQGKAGYSEKSPGNASSYYSYPRLTLTGEATWRPLEALNLRTVIRYEGERYDDDLNIRKLSAATDVNLRADWSVSRAVTLYAAAENLLDARIETAETGDGLESYDQPRTLRIGLVLRR